MAVKLQVFECRIGDVEDPELYAAAPIWEWQNSDMGKWVMETAIEKPIWHVIVDHLTYGYRVSITAKFSDKDATFFKLKYANTNRP